STLTPASAGKPAAPSSTTPPTEPLASDPPSVTSLPHPAAPSAATSKAVRARIATPFPSPGQKRGSASALPKRITCSCTSCWCCVTPTATPTTTLSTTSPPAAASDGQKYFDPRHSTSLSERRWNRTANTLGAFGFSTGFQVPSVATPSSSSTAAW